MGAHQPVVAPVSLPAFPEAVIAPRKTYVQGGGAMRRRWKDKDYICEWDSRHGTVEKYNKRGTNQTPWRI
ncbi:colicin E3/pyocin S6 family cytotoxin [Candidatus Finniella inopinata]|uniref:colicin E3/pyocin S6 family cytotoxin n=1 Tax=Candidatus Finniella inopinata TaxID=1696036 RepID=UPI003B969E33